MKLNLGAGNRTLPGYLSVDIAPPADVIVDLSKYPWPWPDSSISEVFAHEVLEHLPSKRDSMNELWRILVPGGLADIWVPTIRGVGACCDPTHLTFWSAGDFEYYQKGNWARERFRSSEYYGVKADFEIVGTPEQSMYSNSFGEPVWHVRVVMRAIK